MSLVPEDMVRACARAVLIDSWREADGFCPPNPVVYPHQWLWDSCFHAIAWAALGDARGAVELASCLSGRLPSGFVPHMRYLGPTVARGPLPDRSSYTQPPIYAHAARVLQRSGQSVSAETVAAIGQALGWLWSRRRGDGGLVYIVHPWESGADDSPRWDDWIGLNSYDKDNFRAVDRRLVDETVFDDEGAAAWSQTFVVAPAAFNAFCVHAMAEFAELSGDESWSHRAAELSATVDERLWDPDESLWRDEPLVGGFGASSRWPTLDGALGLLSTTDKSKAAAVFDQLLERTRFAAAYGLSYVPPGHPKYDANAYWRGPAWPQLNYMMWVAARRWARDDVADAIAECSRRAAVTSRLAEYWNPETGEGLGAVPQGWAALAAAYG